MNKVDLPSANPEEVTDDIVDLLGCNPEEVIHASGKTGFGVGDILKAIIERVPAPKGNVDEPLQALIIDSVYNTFRGIERNRLSSKPAISPMQTEPPRKRQLAGQLVQQKLAAAHRTDPIRDSCRGLAKRCLE